MTDNDHSQPTSSGSNSINEQTYETATEVNNGGNITVNVDANDHAVDVNVSNKDNNEGINMLVDGIPRNTSGTSNTQRMINVANSDDDESNDNSEKDDHLYRNLQAGEYKVRQILSSKIKWDAKNRQNVVKYQVQWCTKNKNGSYQTNWLPRSRLNCEAKIMSFERGDPESKRRKAGASINSTLINSTIIEEYKISNGPHGIILQNLLSSYIGSNLYIKEESFVDEETEIRFWADLFKYWETIDSKVILYPQLIGMNTNNKNELKRLKSKLPDLRENIFISDSKATKDIRGHLKSRLPVVFFVIHPNGIGYSFDWTYSHSYVGIAEQLDGKLPTNVYCYNPLKRKEANTKPPHRIINIHQDLSSTTQLKLSYGTQNGNTLDCYIRAVDFIAECCDKGWDFIKNLKWRPYVKKH